MISIIERASEFSSADIDGFLDSALPKIDRELLRQLAEMRTRQLNEFGLMVYDSCGASGRFGHSCDLVAAIVYGSMARGDNHILSDIDDMSLTASEHGVQIDYVFIGKLRASTIRFEDEFVATESLESFLEGDAIPWDSAVVIAPSDSIRAQILAKIERTVPDCAVRALLPERNG
ncbi:nucleotidyltransferase domain-containing protein [bacterium]|nr:nucleotidyltransferase domain-containing protein [bacterium]